MLTSRYIYIDRYIKHRYIKHRYIDIPVDLVIWAEWNEYVLPATAA